MLLCQNTSKCYKSTFLAYEEIGCHSYKNISLNVNFALKQDFFCRLELVLHLQKNDELLFTLKDNDKEAIENVKLNSDSASSSNDDSSFPYWILSAMKCLANWPNHTEPDFPAYKGSCLIHL